MQKKRIGRMLCSLSLAAATLWGVSVTAPAQDARSALIALRRGGELGVLLLKWERGGAETDAFSVPVSLALRMTPLLREGEDEIAQAWSAELEQPPADSGGDADAAQDNEENTVLSQPVTTGELKVTENGVTARTLKPSDPSGYTVLGNVYINNGSDAALDASMLGADYAACLGADEPQVLIIHTHGTESYTIPPGQEYDVSDTFRTLDTNCNMIRVGRRLAVQRLHFQPEQSRGVRGTVPSAENLRPVRPVGGRRLVRFQPDGQQRAPYRFDGGQRYGPPALYHGGAAAHGG